MGVINHNAILVTTWEKPERMAPFVEVLRGLSLTWNMSIAGINGYKTFIIAPDGSKEGWEDSDKGDADRDTIVEWLEAPSSPYTNWVEVSYGEYGQSIVRGNNEDRYT